jgi:Tol biopolymer transport system component
MIERQLTANPLEDYVSGAAIAPDGKHVAYVDQTGLYLRSIDSGETNPVSLPEGLAGRMWDLRWFPDGARLLADLEISQGLDLWVITVLGEAAPHLLYRNGVLGAVSPDGRLIAFTSSELWMKGVMAGHELWVGRINGDMPRKLVAAEEGQEVSSPAWSPDGRWIAYLKHWKTAQGSWSSALEVRPAGGGPAKTLMPEASLPQSISLPTGIAMRWAPDWRLVFCARQAAESPSAQGKDSLWAILVEPATGVAVGEPERLTPWLDFVPRDVTITADGKRLSFVKEHAWQDAYLAELGPGGARIKPPRRFTLDNRGINGIECWTRASDAILFSSRINGKTEIFRQGLNESVAETVVEGPGDDYNAQPSPDGSWILYRDKPHPGTSPVRLMRRPVGGGFPEMVLEEPANSKWWYDCPPKASAQCVLSQQEGDRVVVYSLDPVRGKGERLMALEVGMSSGTWFSPDGSRLAWLDGDKDKVKIEVMTLSDGARHEVSLDPKWGEFQSMAWAADGQALFVTTWSPDSYLLYVTLAGKVEQLLHSGHRQWMFNPQPSPDGKHLAYQATTVESNVWMLESF